MPTVLRSVLAVVLALPVLGLMACSDGGEDDASIRVRPVARVFVNAGGQIFVDDREVSLDELATLTRIPRRSLERLESGAFDSNPDGFARGFVRTVAEALGLDPDEAVMRLMREPDEEEAAESAVAGFDAKAWLGGAALLAGLFLGIALAWRLVGAWVESAEAPAENDLVLRRDPVRSLVEEPQPGAADSAGRNAEGQEP